MLYDPKWEQKTKADPLALTSLIAWLERQHCNAGYDARGPNHCLLAQWLRSMDPKAASDISGFDSYQYRFQGKSISLEQFGDIAVVTQADCTFGLALDRARAAAGHV